MAITPASLEKLKSGAISKVIESLGSKLKRVGREYVTQCIWHEDTNPSLTINDDKGFCFCHVCRQGGDVIAYTRQRKGLDFVDAANLSAEILGINLETDGISPEEQAKRKEQRQRALDKLKTEQASYKQNLTNPKAKRIQQILKDRGLTPASSREFGLGFAPGGFFGGRITIPIYNHRNELVGWTGRATGDQPGKYKNSQDGDLFHKKSLVFNEVRAKEAARLSGSLIFVEGHLDVVSLWQHGIANVVAMQGTGAPEPFVLERLAKTVNNFILCFDGDDGGKKATQQFIAAAGPMAKTGAIQINVAQLPKGKDPDQICRESGAEAFHSLTADATPWLDWVIDYWAAGLDKTNAAHVTEVEKALRAEIDGLTSNAVRAHYIDKVARALSHDEKEATKLAKDWGERSVEIGKLSWTPRTDEQVRVMTEARLLRLYIHRPAHRERLRPFLDVLYHPPMQWLRDRILELEEHCSVDLTPHSVMAVVAVSEPHFLHQLRKIVQPSVNIDETEGVLRHVSDIMGKDVPIEPHEPDSDQPPA